MILARKIKKSKDFFRFSVCGSIFWTFCEIPKKIGEAALLARQALAAKRYTSPEGVAVDASPQKGLSPIDSLAAGLAESSLEGSLPPSLSQACAPVDAGNVSGRSHLSSIPDTASPRPATANPLTYREPASPLSPIPSQD